MAALHYILSRCPWQAEEWLLKNVHIAISGTCDHVNRELRLQVESMSSINWPGGGESILDYPGAQPNHGAFINIRGKEERAWEMAALKDSVWSRSEDREMEQWAQAHRWPLKRGNGGKGSPPEPPEGNATLETWSLPTETHFRLLISKTVR